MIKGRLNWAAYFAALAIVASALPWTQRAAAQQTTAAIPQSIDVDQAKIDQGKATFAEKRSHCHGPNMVNPGTITPICAGFPMARRASSTR